MPCSFTIFNRGFIGEYPGGNQCSTPLYEFLLVAIAQNAIGANSYEALRKDMKQKASHELTCSQTHLLRGVVVFAIFPGVGDDSVFDLENTMIGGGDPMGIVSQVLQDLSRTCKGLLGVYHPVFAIAFVDQVLKGGRMLQLLNLAREAKLLILESFFQIMEHFASEKFAEDLHMNKEPVLT